MARVTSHDEHGLVATPPEGPGTTRPTVAILCATGFSLRNVVHSGLLTELSAAGLQPWLLTATSDAEGHALRLPAGCRHETLLEAPTRASQLGLSAQRALVRRSFARRHGVSTAQILDRWRRLHGKRAPAWRDAAIGALSVLGAADPYYHWQMDYLDRRARRSLDLDGVRAQLRSIAPELLVSTACVAYGEYPYLLTASELRIATLGCILSFDNLTSRGPLPTFDHYAVWNARMAEQVRRFHPDRAAGSIHVTGTPQFDFHVRDEFRWSRSETLRRLGLAPNERYVVHAANHAEFTPTEPDLVGALAEAFRRVDALNAHRIVVRPHPYDDGRRWRQVADEHPAVVMSWPVSEAGTSGPEDQARLVSTLLHADVCLNTASTMSLDAAVVDTPMVCVGFAWNRPGRELAACRELHFTDHYRPLVESGGMRLVLSLDELVRELVAYVQDPARDADGRAKLAATQCGVLDGRAAVRIANLIEALALAHQEKSA